MLSQVAGADWKLCVTVVAEPLNCGVPEPRCRNVGGTPFPETATAPPPPVALERTLIVPLKLPAAFGVKTKLTVWLPPDGMFPLQVPENPSGLEIPVTLSGEFPELPMVRITVLVPPTGQSPKLSDVGTLITRVATAVPVPLADTVLAPLVRSEFTVIVPLKSCAAVGLKVTVTFCDPFAGILPVFQLPEKPEGKEMPVTLSAEFPVLEMVIVRVTVWPTVRLPKARSPETPIMRVWATPVPLTAMVLALTASLELTVIFPLEVVAAVGANVTVTFCDAPAAIVPLQLPVKAADG